jgi:hypothetical protein
VPRRAGADPDDWVSEQRAIEEDRLHLPDRERRHGPWLVAGCVPHLLGACDSSLRTACSGGDLGPVGATVAGNEDENRPAVAVEDERLDDLCEVAADCFRGVLGGRRPVRELLDPGLGPRLAQIRGDPLDLLRPGTFCHGVKRSQRN